MILELSRAVSLGLSILSLCALLDRTFFIPATRWEERLLGSGVYIGLAACVCLVSGLLFRHSTNPEVPLLRTLPVRLLLWTLLGLAVLFPICWYLDVYYVPWLWRNQPH
jgi:hypothetical protein